MPGNYNSYAPNWDHARVIDLVGQFGSDPTASRNNGAAWQNAINTAATNASINQPVILYLRDGNYLLERVLYPTGPFIKWKGDGIGGTRIICTPGVSFNSGLFGTLPATYDQYNNQGFSFEDLTIDGNGGNGSVFSSQQSVISMGSDSIAQRIEICNVAGSVNTLNQGTVDILIAGRRVRVKDIIIRDHFNWTTYTTQAMVGTGANLAVNVNSVANFNYVGVSSGNQTIIIDPPVNVYSNAALVAGQTVIFPLSDDDALFGGDNGNSRAMMGIVPGQTLTFDSAQFGGTVETKVVASVGTNFFVLTAGLTNNHGQYCPITYTPEAAPKGTETCQIQGTGAGSITVYNQKQHSSGVAVIGYAAGYDAIAATGQTNLYRTVHDVEISGNYFACLREDMIGAAACYGIDAHNNHGRKIVSGMSTSNSYETSYCDNDIDLSYGGQLPWDFTVGPSQPVNNIFTGIYHTSGAAVAGQYPWTEYPRITDKGNRIKGGSYGILYTGGANVWGKLIDIDGNNIDSPGVNAYYISGVKGLNIRGGSVRNNNSYAMATQNGLPIGVVAAIASAAAGASAIDSLKISDVNMLEERVAGNRSQTTVTIYTNNQATATNIEMEGCIVSSNFTSPTPSVTASAGLDAIHYRNNRNLNPVKSLNTTSARTWSPATAINGQPVSATNYTNVSGVDQVLYCTTAGTCSAFAIDGATLPVPVLGGGYDLPAGSSFTVTWTVQPVFTVYGK